MQVYFTFENMICFPNAKINLGLHVISKREDGYHNIDTALYPISLCDTLEFFPSKEYKLKVYGNDISIPVADNLVSKAWLLMRKEFGIPPVDVKLLKTIPQGSGLGGGSSDASFILKGLNQLFDLKLGSEKLHLLASQIGSDCPFFIYNTPALISETGNKIEPIANILGGLFLLVVFPQIQISTREAFHNITPKSGRVDVASILQNNVTDWKGILKNDFEEWVFQNHPSIEGIKQSLYDGGAVYTSLTGSGSAVYGLFRQMPDKLKLGKNFDCRWIKL